MTTNGNSDTIMTASGLTVRLDGATTERGEVVYQITYVTPGHEIEAGAITVSTDSRVQPEAGQLSVHFGSGDLSDRHLRTDAPLVGVNIHAVGRSAVDPAKIGPNGEDFQVRVASASTGTRSYWAEPGSTEQRRAGELVAAVVGLFQSREDFAHLAGLNAAHMAPERLAAPLAKRARIQAEIDGRLLDLAEIDAQIAQLSAHGTGAVSEPEDSAK